MHEAYIVDGMRLLVAALIALPFVAAADVPGAQLSDDGPMRNHFEPDATVILPGSITNGTLPAAKLDGFTNLEYGTVDAFKAGKPTTGNKGGATWYLADIKQAWRVNVDCGVEDPRCKRSRTLRLSELVVGGKVVVMHVDDPSADRSHAEASDTFASPTEPGPLAKLIVDPAAIAKTWLDDPSTFVLGTEVGEKAVGPAAAKKLLGSWSKLALAIDGKPREVIKGGWGYAAANIVWTAKGKKTAMRATLYAVQVNGAWKVVGVHFSIPFKRDGLT